MPKVTVRIERKVRDSVSEICKRFGLCMETVIRNRIAAFVDLRRPQCKSGAKPRRKMRVVDDPVRLAIRIDECLREDFYAACAFEGRSITEAILQIMNDLIHEARAGAVSIRGA